MVKQPTDLAGLKADNDRLRHEMRRVIAEREDARSALVWAMSHVREPRLIRGQNDEHHAAYQRAKAAIAPPSGPTFVCKFCQRVTVIDPKLVDRRSAAEHLHDLLPRDGGGPWSS